MTQPLQEMSLAELAFEYRQAGRFPFDDGQVRLSDKILEELRRRDKRYRPQFVEEQDVRISTHVVGFKPATEKHKKMMAVVEACRLADVDPPKEVDDYFGFNNPDAAGVEVSEKVLLESGAVKKWGDGDSRDGFEVDVTKLPKDITTLRFYNSW